MLPIPRGGCLFDPSGIVVIRSIFSFDSRGNLSAKMACSPFHLATWNIMLHGTIKLQATSNEGKRMTNHGISNIGFSFLMRAHSSIETSDR